MGMFLCQQVEKYMAILKKYVVLHFRVLFVIKFFMSALIISFGQMLKCGIAVYSPVSLLLIQEHQKFIGY